MADQGQSISEFVGSPPTADEASPTHDDARKGAGGLTVEQFAGAKPKGVPAVHDAVQAAQSPSAFEVAGRGLKTGSVVDAAKFAGRMYEGGFDAAFHMGRQVVGDVVAAAVGLYDPQKGKAAGAAVGGQAFSEVGKAEESEIAAGLHPVAKWLTWPEEQLDKHGYPRLGLLAQAGSDLLGTGVFAKAAKAVGGIAHMSAEAIRRANIPATEAAEEAITQTKLRVQLRGTDARTGKPRVRITTPAEAGAALRTEAANASAAVHSTSPNISVAGKPGRVVRATSGMKGPVADVLKVFAPEMTSNEAARAGAIVASNFAESAHTEAVQWQGAEERLNFWQQKRNADQTDDFINRYEQGKPQINPQAQMIADHYARWNDEIYQHEQGLGMEYEPRDDYLYHVFEDGDKVDEWLTAQFGNKWRKPGFMKERGFDLYAQAKAAGFTPKYTSPEEIMLARQHASNVATMRINVLNDLANSGLATEGRKGLPGWVARRSPNGKQYMVHPGAALILQRAFDSKSLWQLPGVWGDSYRKLMEFKNVTVGTELSFSLFHPMHVLHIDHADSLSRAMGNILSGKAKWRDLRQSIPLYSSLMENPLRGGRAVKVFRGLVPSEQMTAQDRLGMKLMVEGGFVPGIPDVYRIHSGQQFMKALRAYNPAKMVLHSWGAALQAMRWLPFDVWIPNLKAASYLHQADSVLRRDPTLVHDLGRRQIALRRVAKSVDNRYGEMNYNNLFWPHMLKDIGVANTLSMGWQLGFFREYGGALGQAAKLARAPMRIGKQLARGDLDKLLFGSYYMSSALAIGGLMTYFMGGQQPHGLDDLIYPIVGMQHDGKPMRVNTMFFTREIGSLQKHIEQEGMVKGISDIARSKSSGVIGDIGELFTGVNEFGDEIRNPDSPIYKQIEQTLNSYLEQVIPIGLRDDIPQLEGGESEDTGQDIRDVLGFTKAPRYAVESKTEGKIDAEYREYVKAAVTPYDEAQRSQEYSRLHQLYNNGDARFDDELDKVADKYNLGARDVKQLRRDLESDATGEERKFQRLPWEKQKALLEQMTPDERDQYMRFANKEHIRDESDGAD